MKKLLRRIGGALLMGVAWAVVWAPVGLLVGMVVDPHGSMDEPWIAVGTYPGFLSAVVFSIVIWIAERGRRFDGLSLTRVGAWGALAGLLVGMLPLVALILDRGNDVAGSTDTTLPTWLVVVIGVITLLGALSAAGSLALARTRNFNLLDASAGVAEVGLTGGDGQDAAGGRR